MTLQVEQHMAKMGLALPLDWMPRGQFLPFSKDGTIVYLSGQICEWAGEITHIGPVLDTPKAIEDAQAATRICVLNLIYRLRDGIVRQSLTRLKVPRLYKPMKRRFGTTP
jgi:hypothetical protein